MRTRRPCGRPPRIQGMRCLTNTTRLCGYRFHDRRSEAHRRRPYFLLAQSLTAKSPLCRPRQDTKNSHRAETEVSLRLMRQPSGRGTDQQPENPLNICGRACASFCAAIPPPFPLQLPCRGASWDASSHRVDTARPSHRLLGSRLSPCALLSADLSSKGGTTNEGHASVALHCGRGGLR
jgi:hypothetical protein